MAASKGNGVDTIEPKTITDTQNQIFRINFAIAQTELSRSK